MANKELPEYKILSIHKTDSPRFIKPAIEVTYEVNNKEHKWEIIPEPHDTVHVLVNNTDKQKLVLVKQVRVPVLVNSPSIDNGIVIECCAGLIDGFNEVPSNQRPLFTAVAEVFEELGYNTLESKFVILPSYLSSVGTVGSTCYPYYVEVTDSQFVGQSLGQDEYILSYEVDYSDVHILTSVSNIDATTRYMLYWFLVEILRKVW